MFLKGNLVVINMGKEIPADIVEHSGESERVERPVYAGDMSLVVDVGQNAQAVTRGDDPKPVLATFASANTDSTRLRNRH